MPPDTKPDSIVPASCLPPGRRPRRENLPSDYTIETHEAVKFIPANEKNPPRFHTGDNFQALFGFFSVQKKLLSIDRTFQEANIHVFRIWGFAPSPHQRAFRFRLFVSATGSNNRKPLWKPSGRKYLFLFLKYRCYWLNSLIINRFPRNRRCRAGNTCRAGRSARRACRAR